MALSMTPFFKKNLVAAFSVVLFAALIRSLHVVGPLLSRRVQHVEFILLGGVVLVSAIIMLFWAISGVFGGLVSFLAAMIFLFRPLTALNPYDYAVLLIVFFVSMAAGYYFHRKLSVSRQNYTVMLEKITEDNNLISDHMKNREAEVSAMGQKIDGLLKIKNIADKLSVIMDEDKIIKAVSKETFTIMGPDKRITIFLFDEAANELNLSITLKGGGRRPFSGKKGGIFESWVIKNAKSLLVKDIRKDFRFSMDDEAGRDDTVSLLIKPLIIENNFLGAIRVDSPVEDAFSAHELRILDIIGDLSSVAIENTRLYRQTEDLAVKDSLTGLYVHRYFMERLDDEVKRSLRNGNPLALFMLDIDDFKKFNDEHGHIAGDAILKNIGSVLRGKAAAGDTVARYGGEEFAFLLLKNDKKAALSMAEDIRKKIEDSHVVLRRKKCAVTVSIGVAMFPDDARLKDDLVLAADRALYKAKSKGKNRVCSK